ncbi:MAG: phosphatidylserine decarboxylase [Bacillota bacterium]|uniref:phosphatidylserine decarboxylase n=1 Tax=Rossellomorea sp. FM04394 TaxID=3243076 RepID=UPI0035A6C861
MWMKCVDYVHERKEWKQGEEVAYFSFGSTVILLFERDTFQFSRNKEIPRDVTVGETIGDFRSIKKRTDLIQIRPISC